MPSHIPSGLSNRRRERAARTQTLWTLAPWVRVRPPGTSPEQAICVSFGDELGGFFCRWCITWTGELYQGVPKPWQLEKGAVCQPSETSRIWTFRTKKSDS